MAVASELRAHSFRESLRQHWIAFSKTAIGDIIATAIAITAMSVLFLAASLAVLSLSRITEAVFRLLGG